MATEKAEHVNVFAITPAPQPATDPEEFQKFHKLLTEGRPDFIPWYIPLGRGEVVIQERKTKEGTTKVTTISGKEPLVFGSWKDVEHRLSYAQAYKRLQGGRNVGVAARGFGEDGQAPDRLVILDVDDMDLVGATKTTLQAISRKRFGRHNFYITEEPARGEDNPYETTAKDNIPLDDAGELRSCWQYVVAPGSFVPCGPDEYSRIPEEDRHNAGKYSLLNPIEPANIAFNELPEIFKAKRIADIKNAIEHDFKKAQRQKPEDRHSKSMIFELSASDVLGYSCPDFEKFPSPLHGSSTGANASFTGPLLHCWRHNVSHSGYSLLAVQAGLYDCGQAGTPHKHAGVSYLKYDGEEIFTVWKYAKEHNHIPDEDPIPTKALIHYATSNGHCKESDITDGWKLPADAYNRSLAALREDGINPGRAPIGEVREEDYTLDVDLDTILKDIDTSGSVLTRGKNAKADFLKLEKLPISERRLGCKEIWKKYKLGSKEFDQAYKEIFEIIHTAKRTEAQQNEEPVENDVLDIYTDDVKEYAMDILERGDPFAFILEVVNKYHVGDTNIKKLCLVSFGTCHITTSYGLQLKPAGPSGKGKTHTFDNVAIVLPSHKVFRGSMSGMSAYYNGGRLKDGMIFLLDDTDLNRTEGLKNTIKRAASNFQKRTTHLTVVKGKGKEVELPARALWWISSVRGVDDDQLGNRFIPIDVDGTKEQDGLVHDWQKKQHLYGLNPDDDTDVQVCRCIYDILGKETYKIVIPFVDAITWNNKDNRRNFPMFLDVVMGVTFHYIKQRECINGGYWATVEDCEKAIEIYGEIEEQNASNLTEEETRLISWMGDQFRAGTWLDRNTIQGYLKKSNKHVRVLFHGEDANGGLLAKVPQLEYEKRQVKDDSGSRDKAFYCMTEQYQKYGQIVKLKKEAVDTVIKNYSQFVGTSTTSTPLVVKKTSAFSQSGECISRALVVNGSSVIEEKQDIPSNVNEGDISHNDVCVISDIQAKHEISTSAPRITAEDTEKSLVQNGTSGVLVSTSANRPCLSKESRLLLLEKIPRWEMGNFKITVDNIPRAVIGIAELVREANTDTIKKFLLEYVDVSPAEVVP